MRREPEFAAQAVYDTASDTAKVSLDDSRVSLEVEDIENATYVQLTFEPNSARALARLLGVAADQLDASGTPEGSYRSRF